MVTECHQESFGFHALGRREVVARFDGGRITSEGGGRLLRETERVTGIIRQFAACFTDHRDPKRIEHAVEALITQRVYAFWFSSVAYTLMAALRRLGLKDTSMAKARCDTIRLKLLKFGARIRVTVRKVWVSLAESCPYQRIFRQVYANLVGERPMSLRC